MKNTFRYAKPTLLNNLGYATLVAGAFALVHFRGQAVVDWASSRWSDFALFAGGGFALYLLVFWTWGLFYILLDRYRWPAFLYRYRIQAPPPGRPEKTSQPTTAEAVRVTLLNQFLGTLPVLLGVAWLLPLLGIHARAPVPPLITIALKLVGMVLIEEVLFFSAHLLLHTRPLFRTIHHIHHRYRQPIGISTHYVHYIEHLFGSLVPIFAAILLVRADLATSFLWVTFAVTNAIHTHSDYEFPWMVPAINHDFHHYAARGNYGVLGLMDWIFGTDREYRALAREAEQAEAGQRAA